MNKYFNNKKKCVRCNKEASEEFNGDYYCWFCYLLVYGRGLLNEK